MKKRLISLILVGFIGTSLIACGESKNNEGNGDKKVESQENNKNKEESENNEVIDKNLFSKDEIGYVPLTQDEVIELHKKKLPIFRDFFNKLNLEPYEGDNHKTEGDRIEGIAYLNWSAEDTATRPGYGGISYSAAAGEKSTYIAYDFYYFVDYDNKQVPQVEDLYITEPYKLLTDKDMSQESIDKLNSVLKDAYENGIGLDEEIIIEEKGNFEVYVRLTSSKLKFRIVSGGRVIG